MLDRGDIERLINEIVLTVANDSAANQGVRELDRELEHKEIKNMSCIQDVAIFARPCIGDIRDLIRGAHPPTEAACDGASDAGSYRMNWYSLVWYSIMLEIFVDEYGNSERKQMELKIAELIDKLSPPQPVPVEELGTKLRTAGDYHDDFVEQFTKDSVMRKHATTKTQPETNIMKSQQILAADFTGTVNVIMGHDVAELTKDDAVVLLGRAQYSVKQLGDSPAKDTKFIQDKVTVINEAIVKLTAILNK